MFTFIKKVYKNQKKDYHMLLLILVLISSFEFTFLAMYDAFTRFHFTWDTRISLLAIPTLASAVSVVLNIFVTKYFILNKKQEFSILLLSGRKPKDLLHYLLIQFGILTLIAYIIGNLLGIIFMYVINTLLVLQQNTVILQYTPMSVWLYSFCFFIFTLIVILAISAHQFVKLDLDLAKYLSQKTELSQPSYQIKSSAITSKRKIPIFSILITCLIIYLSVSSLFQLIQPHLGTRELLMAFTYSLAGIYAFIITTIPLLYDLFHHRLLKHPILMNAFSSFNEFSRVMITLVSLNMIILPIMLFLIFFSSHHIAVQAIVLPCFIMIVLMIGLCFILRFFIYDQERRSSVSTFNAIGYSHHTLNQISLIKNILFTLFTFIIPFLFISELFYKASLEGILSQDIIIIMIISYIFIDFFIVIYIVMKERITQKEVTDHAKYLNRGQ